MCQVREEWARTAGFPSGAFQAQQHKDEWERKYPALRCKHALCIICDGILKELEPRSNNHYAIVDRKSKLLWGNELTGYLMSEGNIFRVECCQWSCSQTSPCRRWSERNLVLPLIVPFAQIGGHSHWAHNLGTAKFPLWRSHSNVLMSCFKSSVGSK